ncbi:hypothetical protein BMF94_5306 [Rhodotorula taiwanensis]|uniref:C2H2-type domain-containing protein n=1 Tax=Rhodotorula taiwanensis TaxID=741276 RepID=A0A2S5B4A6_9BASI|nr:hypothetical protein BMF94_5306 [Rhodotorula taiwanensis]
MAHAHASHWFCEPCDQTFSTRAARRSHSNRSQRHIHDFCGWCDRFLEAGEDMNDHDEDYHYPCRACDEVCESLEDCNEHGRLYHFWCDTHERAFRSQSNYDQHMRSAAHVGLGHRCPARNCGRSFRDRATLLQHLESGTCPSGVNRRLIDDFIAKHDRHRIITTGPSRNLLVGAAPAVRYIATERSCDWTRSVHVCALCQSEHDSLQALNNHWSLPRHTYAGANGPDGRRPYKCPLSTCGRQSNTLSGVVQHAESRSCAVLQAPRVVQALDNVFGGMRLLPSY